MIFLRVVLLCLSLSAISCSGPETFRGNSKHVSQKLAAAPTLEDVISIKEYLWSYAPPKEPSSRCAFHRVRAATLMKEKLFLGIHGGSSDLIEEEFRLSFNALKMIQEESQFTDHKVLLLLNWTYFQTEQVGETLRLAALYGLSPEDLWAAFQKLEEIQSDWDQLLDDGVIDYLWDQQLARTNIFLVKSELMGALGAREASQNYALKARERLIDILKADSGEDVQLAALSLIPLLDFEVMKSIDITDWKVHPQELMMSGSLSDREELSLMACVLFLKQGEVTFQAEEMWWRLWDKKMADNRRLDDLSVLTRPLIRSLLQKGRVRKAFNLVRASKSQGGELLALADLKARLEQERGLLVEYYLDSKRLSLFTCHAQPSSPNDTLSIEVLHVDIPSVIELTRKVITYRDLIASSEVMREVTFRGNSQLKQHVFDQGFKLKEKLFPDAFEKRLLENEWERIFISPHLGLYHTPFEALRVAESQDDNAWLIHHFPPLLVAPHSLQQSERKKIENQKGAFWVRGRFAEGAGKGLSALPGVHREVAEVRKIWGGDLFSESAASERTFWKYAPSIKGPLYFATHAWGRGSELTHGASLVLSGSAYSGRDDGYLSSTEIKSAAAEGVRLQSPLVVLSACETTMGKEKIFFSNNSHSLAESFLQIGVAQVIGSRWKASDRYNQFVLPRLILGIRRGETPEVAMCRVQKRQAFTKESGVPDFSWPFYWSSLNVLTR